MPDKPGLTPLGKIVVFLIIVGCIGAAAYRFWGGSIKLPWFKGAAGSGSAADKVSSLFSGPVEAEIGVAYGTEKQRWIEWAVTQFAKSPEGKRIKVNLIPMGSIEGAHAILAGDQRINAWSPASTTNKDVFVEEWKAKYGDNPIVKEENIALSPMVFVIWEERYQAFVQHYKTLSFATVAQALQEKGGWDTIARKPEWGLFKYGHTHPNQSNSGLQALTLAAYSYFHKTRDLTVGDIVNVEFQKWLQGMEHAVSGLSNSTGNMMKEMVLKGPSSYDVLLAYEAVAIDYLRNAEGRWGQIRLVYPEYNSWNDNPYYVLNAPWSKPEQRKAAEAFLTFLMSEPVQKEALVHGYRPGNPSVPVKTAESPLVQYASYGVQIDLQKICDPPKAEVVNNLLASWERSQGAR